MSSSTAVTHSEAQATEPPSQINGATNQNSKSIASSTASSLGGGVGGGDRGGQMNVNPSQIDIVVNPNTFGLKDATFSNSYIMQITNEEPQRKDFWIQGSSNAQHGKVGFGMAMNSTFKYIPNRNFYNYVTPAQLLPYIENGATGYRVKSCALRIHNLYQASESALDVGAAGKIRTFDGSHFKIINSKICKNIHYNEQSTAVNPNVEVDTPFDDRFQYSDAYHISPSLQSYTADKKDGAEVVAWDAFPNINDVNEITKEAYVFMPHANFSTLSDPTRTRPQFGDHNVRQEYSIELERYEDVNIVRPGQEYHWAWDNPSNQFIGFYRGLMRDPNTSEATTKELRDLTRLNIENVNQYNYNKRDFQFAYQNAPSSAHRDTGNKTPKMMDPLLVRIPRYLPDTGDNVQFVRMYADITYTMEIEFSYNNPHNWGQFHRVMRPNYATKELPRTFDSLPVLQYYQNNQREFGNMEVPIYDPVGDGTNDDPFRTYAGGIGVVQTGTVDKVHNSFYYDDNNTEP